MRSRTTRSIVKLLRRSLTRHSAKTVAVGALLLASHSASATDHTWTLGGTGTTGGGTGLFETATAVNTNWSVATIPGAADNVFVNNGGTVQMGFGTVTTYATFDCNSGTITNGSGTYTLQNSTSGATTLTVNSWFRQGEAAGSTGTFNLNGGTVNIGTTQATSQINFAENATATGKLNITAGAFNDTASSLLSIGQNGTGIVTISGGTFTNSSSGAASLGTNATGIGTMTISGTGAYTGTGTAVLNIGLAGKGTLNMQGGTFTNASDVNMGSTATTGAGTLNVSGGTMAFNGASGSLEVGDANAATGTVFQTGGTVTTANELWVGNNTGAIGIYNLSAGNVSSGSYLAVGRASGTGTFNISGTGVYTKTNGTGVITIGAGGTGTVNQTGGSIINTASGTWIGESATATYNISAGLANLGGASGYLDIGRAAGNGTVNLSGTGVISTNQVQHSGSTTGTFNFNGGTLQAAKTNTTFMQGLTVANVRNGGATIDTNTFNDTIAQALVHSTIGGDNATDGGLTKVGAGTLTLTGANTYNGGTTINAGTIAINTAASLGATSGMATINNGTLEATTGITTSRNFLLGSANSTVQVDGAGTTYTLSGTLSDGASAGTLNKTGAGTLALTGVSTYTGATNVNAGNVTLDHSGSNMGTLGNTAVTVAGGSGLFVKGSTTIGSPGTGSLALTGGATTAAQGTLDLRDLSINTLGIGGNFTLGTGANGTALGFDIGSASGSNDVINVSGTVTTSSTGTTAATGATTINLFALGSIASGTTNYTLINAVGGGLTPGGGGFTLGVKPAGFNQYSLANSTANAEILTINATATVVGNEYWTGAASQVGSPADSIGPDANNNWGFGSTFSTPKSNWSVNPDGSGDPLQVPGATTDVIFTATNAVPTAATTALTTQLDGAYNIRSLTFNVPAATTITTTTVNTNGNTLTVGANGLTLAGTSNSSGTISGTGSVILNGSQSWANNNGQALTVSTGITGLTGATTLTLNGTGTGGVTLSGPIGNGGATTLGLVLNQAGVTTLGGANTFTGGIAMNSGTVVLGNNGALNSNALTFGAGSTSDLRVNGFSVTAGGLNTNATLGTPVIENASATAGTLTDNDTASDAFAGIIQDGTGGGALALNKTGSNTSTLTLSGVNTFTGPVNITNGNLTITNSSALGVGVKAVNINNGTAGNDSLTLDSQGGPAITLGSNLSFNTSSVTGGIFNANGANTIAGNFALTAGGGGTAFTVNGGTLALTGNITASTAGRSVNLAGAGNGAITGVISDGVTGGLTGGVNKTAGVGLWNLSGANTYTGPTTVAAGTLQAGVATVGTTSGAFGVGSAVTVSNVAGATLDLNNFNESIGSLGGGGALGGNVTMGTASLTVGQGTTASTFGGVISGSGSVTETGTTGTLTLTNAETYTGATTISGGSLQLGTGATGLDGSIAGTTGVSDSGTLIYNLFGNRTPAYIVSGPGALTKTGAGTLTETAANTYTGQTNINGGVLNAGTADNTGVSGPLGASGTISFGGGTLQFSAANQFDYSSRFSQAAAQQYSVDTNGQNVSFATGLTSTGGSLIHKYGTGTLNLNGAAYAVQSFFANGGTTVLAGATTLTTTNYSSIGQSGTDNGALTMNGASAFTVNGDFNVGDVGPAVGTLNINGTAAAQGLTLYVGKNAGTTGIVNQTGGSLAHVTAAGGNDWQIGSATTSVGIYNISGGTFSNGGNNFQVGSTGTGEMNISGTGAVTSTGGYPVVGRYAGGYGVLDVSGGSFTHPTATTTLLVGEQGTGTLNIRGTGSVIDSGTSGIEIGGGEATAGTTGIVNLDGGTLTTPKIITGSATDSSTLDFNGGTLKAGGASATFLTGLSNAYVYSGGAKFDTSGNAITVGQVLKAPTGSGVTSVAVTNGGSGYATAPIVQISGGGGTGATAVATMSGGVVTGITITNPGVGYTSAPTVTLVTGGSGGSGAAFTPTVAANASGGLTVIDSTAAGTGALTLTSPETYTGPTVVGGNGNAVTLATSGTLNAGGSFKNTSGVTINNLGTVSVSGDNNYLGSAAITANTTVNTGGLLTINAATTTAHLGPLTLAGGTLGSTGTPAGDGLQFGTWNLDSGVAAGGTAATATISAQDVALTQTNGTIFNVASGATSGIDLNVTGTIFHSAGAGDTGLIKQGTGVLQLSGVNTYTSATEVANGTLTIAAAGSIAGNAVTVDMVNPDHSVGTLNVNGTLSTTTALTDNGTVNFNNTVAPQQIASLGGNGIVMLTASSLSVGSGSFGGSINGTGSLTKTGAGTMTLSGTNRYGGGTTVNGGTLVLATVTPPAISDMTVGTGGITVTGDGSGTTSATSGALQLASSNQIANGDNLTLSGGTFNANDSNEGAANGASGAAQGAAAPTQGLGALSVTAPASGPPTGFSFIDFGPSVGAFNTLAFANSNPGGTGTFGAGLEVLDYQYNFGASAPTDHLFFGTDASGLSAQQLGQISFVNVNGVAGNNYAATMLTNGEVSIAPTPEPGGIIPILVGLAGTGVLVARRRRKAIKENCQNELAEAV